MINDDALGLENISAGILRDGYFISKNAVKLDVIDKLRAYVISLVSNNPSVSEAIVWDPYRGEKDKICYSDDDFQCMYRGYLFPWNKNDEAVSFTLFERLNLERELTSQKVNAKEGKHYRDIYTTWSYYPPNIGWLKEHCDTTDSDHKLIHCILPVTFKGRDYESGGLFLFDRKGSRIDVDGLIEPGDILFFDGGCKHGVDIIKSKQNMGRIQAFAIPVEFKQPENCDRLIEDISVQTFVKVKLIHKLRSIKRRVF